MCLDRSGTENTLLTRLQEVSRRSQTRKSDDDWATKVYDLCREVWASLGDCQDQDTMSSSMKAFVDLVQEDDTFTVAQMAIPEFRSWQTHNIGKAGKDILTAVDVLRTLTVQNQNRTQAYYDLQQPHYHLEKLIFHQAELHRVCHLLYDHDKLNSEEEAKIWEWMSARPRNERVEEGSLKEALQGLGNRGDLKDEFQGLGGENKGGEIFGADLSLPN